MTGGSENDRILLVLADNFDTADDLGVRIDQIWMLMDVEEAGTLSHEELLDGLRQLPVNPKLYILSEDLEQVWDTIKVAGPVLKRKD